MTQAYPDSVAQESHEANDVSYAAALTPQTPPLLPSLLSETAAQTLQSTPVHWGEEIELAPGIYLTKRKPSPIVSPAAYVSAKDQKTSATHNAIVSSELWDNAGWLEEEVHRLALSIKALISSNEQLASFAQQDPECVQFLRENEMALANQRDKIKLYKARIKDLGSCLHGSLHASVPTSSSLAASVELAPEAQPSTSAPQESSSLLNESIVEEEGIYL